MKDDIENKFIDGVFSRRKWDAPELSSAGEIRKRLEELNVIGRKIARLKMIGLSYEHTVDGIEDEAYYCLERTHENENEVQRLSDYENIPKDLMFSRHAQIDEPFLIRFEDGDTLEILCPVEEVFQIGINQIPWDIKPGINWQNEDADNLFSDCVGQVVAGIELNALDLVMTEDKNVTHKIVPRICVENDPVDEIVLRFKNGGGVSFSSEYYDYCAVYSFDKNREIARISFSDLKKGLFN